MTLSKRMTENNRDEKPAIHAKARTKNIIRLFQPPGLENAPLTVPISPVSAILLLKNKYEIIVITLQ